MEENDDDQYQKRLKKRVSEALKAAQIENQKKELMKQFLDAKAYERLMNIRVSNYELYNHLVGLVASLAQSNRISEKITESQLKSIIEKITYRREPKIEFKRK
jgi:programmed cell death protein 5